MKMEEDDIKKRKSPYALRWEQIVSPTAAAATVASCGEHDPPPPSPPVPLMKKSKNGEVNGTDLEIRESIARYKKNLQNFGSKLSDNGDKIKESIRRLEDELVRRKKLQSNKIDSTVSSPDRAAGNKPSENFCKSQSGVATNALTVDANEHDSLTDAKMQKIVNELVNVGISETDVGKAAEVCYDDPVKVKVLFALPSHMRRFYADGFLQN